VEEIVMNLVEQPLGRHLAPFLAVLVALPLTPVRAADWEKQAAADAKQDRTVLAFDGKDPDRMVCDTTLRELPDGSWILFMLAGGNTEPSPKNYTGVTRSKDRGKTWSPLERFDVGFPREGATIGQGPTELMVRGGRSTLFFSTHAKHWNTGWRSWFLTSDDSFKTWSKPSEVPGRLKERTFIRNHIVTRDGRILVPFQHYIGPDAEQAKPPLERKFTNPRNGVLISGDGGKTWSEHGNIRLTQDDQYFGWAENNLAERADGRIAMIIRADRLGGVLYYAESPDGGKTWPEFARKTDIPNPGSKATLYSLGGDAVALLHNPNATHRSPLALWISFDGMKTWPYRRVLVAESSDGPRGRLNYPDGFVSRDKQWLHFAFDDNRHRAVYYGAKLPPVPVADAKPAPKQLNPVEAIAAGLEPMRTVVYKKVGDRELRLHLFEPQGHKASDQRPAVLFFHGGGWTGGAPRRMYPYAAHFAKRGLVGVSVEYRLIDKQAGTNPFDCVKDGRSAVRYLRTHARELGIDPDRIIASGASAGGHVAAGTALFNGVDEAGEDGKVSSVPNALVLLYPVIDTSKEGYGQAKIGARWQDISPLHQVRRGLPPTLVFHGTADTVTPFQGARAFHQAMQQAGNRCELVAHEGGKHGYLLYERTLFDETLKKIEDFLRPLGLLEKAAR
jgi:acetyl esterase/lipase